MFPENADAFYAEVIEKYTNYVNPGLAKLMAFAGFGVEFYSEGCYLYDHEGKKFLDCLGGYGVFALGHRHPKVVEAVKKQLDLIALSGKAFFSKPAADLAEAIAEITPGNLQYTFFSNSGTETVEAALKFARKATGRANFVSTQGSYHGKTLGAVSVTGREKYKIGIGDLIGRVDFVEYGNADALAAVVNQDTAAVIIEPIQGEGGIIVPPAGYLTRIREICTQNGALMIADEVQTCLGRTGAMFGVDRENVVPDILTMAKQLGGGIMPIGATVGTPEVWEKVFGENPMFHTSTFGGNPLACAAGLAAIQVVKEEGLVEKSAEVGAFMKQGLQDIASRQDLVVEARGEGLMLGVEFAQDEVGELCVAQMMKRGLCAAYTLNNPRVMRFEPPLIITKEQVEWALKTFEEALVETKEILQQFV